MAPGERLWLLQPHPDFSKQPMLVEFVIAATLFLLIFEIDFRASGDLDSLLITAQLKRRDVPITSPIKFRKTGDLDPIPPPPSYPAWLHRFHQFLFQPHHQRTIPPANQLVSKLLHFRHLREPNAFNGDSSRVFRGPSVHQ